MSKLIIKDQDILELLEYSKGVEDLVAHSRANRDLYRRLKRATSFLPDNSRAKQRLWHVEHQTTEIPKCKTCMVREVSWIIHKNKGYNRFCSSKCAQASAEVKELTQQTNLAKYGVEWNIQSEQSIKKAAQTLELNYGVTSLSELMTLPEFVDKRKQTNMTRYGSAYALSADTGPRVKAEQTMLYKYGTTIPMKNAGIRNKVKELWRNKPNSKLTKEQTTVLTDPRNLSKLNLKYTVSSIAKQINISQPTVSKYFKKYNIKTIKHSNYSTGEVSMAEFVKEHYSGIIELNTRSVISPLELDIYLPDLKLAIEYNGTYWHSELSGKDKKYHISKMQQCNDKGIRLIQVTDVEWITKRNIIESKIIQALKQTGTKIYARKCEIVEVSNAVAREFQDNTHVQGSCNARYNYGLQYEGEIVALMTFSKPRYHNKFQYEMIRYSTKLNTSVVGGASRLLKHFIRVISPISIISYCDLRYGTGNMYEQIGMTFAYSTPPNYKYFKRNSGSCPELYTRVAFQKHKLASKLEVFNPDLTEYQNMIANGYDRIWDCGNHVYVWMNEIT